MIPTYVLDSSFALAWFFEDQVTPSTEAFLCKLAAGEIGAIGPIFLEAEVANALRVAEQRARLTPQQADTSFGDFAALRIEMPYSHEAPFGFNLLLGSRLKLTPVAASYLNLAKDRGLPLATLDPRMAEAAKSLGIQLLN